LCVLLVDEAIADVRDCLRGKSPAIHGAAEDIVKKLDSWARLLRASGNRRIYSMNFNNMPERKW
jgi:hypothetical protein